MAAVTCLTCNETFTGLPNLPLLSDHDTHTLQCMIRDTHVSPCVFRSPKALKQHLEDSHHKRLPHGAIKSAIANSAQQWTILSTGERTSVTQMLVAMAHAGHVLESYGYGKNILYSHEDFVGTPPPIKGVTKSWAVALDCEMVGTKQDDRQLARLYVIDFLTGETLIDRLVKPDGIVIEWRTEITGISKLQMSEATRNGLALLGRQEAREELFKHIDSDTILVGHALHHDLKSLRLNHSRVVDTSILTSQAVSVWKRKWSLKDLCDDLLCKPIRNGVSGVHDAVENAFAAREIVLAAILRPLTLTKWATKENSGEDRNAPFRKQRQETRRRTQPRFASRPCTDFPSTDASSDNDEELMIMSQEEFNEMCGYPVGYDNWD